MPQSRYLRFWLVYPLQRLRPQAIHVQIPDLTVKSKSAVMYSE